MNAMTAELAAQRKARRISQAEIGQEIGVTQTAVSYWETGHREMGATELAAYAQAVGMRWSLVGQHSVNAEELDRLRYERAMFAMAIANVVVLSPEAREIVTELLRLNHLHDPIECACEVVAELKRG